MIWITHCCYPPHTWKEDDKKDLAYAHVEEGSDGEPIPDKKEWQEGDSFRGCEYQVPEAPEGLTWNPGPVHGMYVLEAAESHWAAAELEEGLFGGEARLKGEHLTLIASSSSSTDKKGEELVSLI